MFRKAARLAQPVASTKARAKMNLLLSVTPGADATGYHAVETVMCQLDLADDVRVMWTGVPGVRLTCLPNPLPQDAPASANIAYRAAVAMGEAFGRELACDIEVRKVVPSQAGLGGGSSDAAAVMRCLAQLWDVEPADVRLQAVAALLGADVPFFLHERTTLLTGRGDVPAEHFAPFSVPVVLVKPPAGVPTGEAYRLLDELAPQTLDARPLVEALRRGDVEAALASCGNNMEPGAFRIAPELVDVYVFLDEQPGVVCQPLLCGSGSCVAAFARSDADAELIAAQARAHAWWSCATRTFA